MLVGVQCQLLLHYPPVTLLKLAAKIAVCERVIAGVMLSELLIFGRKVLMSNEFNWPIRSLDAKFTLRLGSILKVLGEGYVPV